MRTLRHLLLAFGFLASIGCATTPSTPCPTVPARGLAAFPTFPATGGGGLSTVTTSGAVSGDGSSGNPVTIAAHALPLTQIATQAGNTITANATGSTASPTAVGLDACHSFAGGVLTDLCPFSADSSIMLNNSTPAAVTAFEGISTLTTATAGSEVSKYEIRLLDGTASAHQSVVMSLRPFQVLYQWNTNVSPSNPTYAFAGDAHANSTGIYYDPAGGFGGTYAMKFVVNGGPGAGNPTMILSNSTGDLSLTYPNPKIQFSSAQDFYITRAAGGGGVYNTTNATGDHQLQISGSPGLTVTHLKSVLIGSAAVATTATDGFLYVTASAGPPTGVPTPVAGRIPFTVDSTNGKAYIYVNSAWAALNFTYAYSFDAPASLRSVLAWFGGGASNDNGDECEDANAWKRAACQAARQ